MATYAELMQQAQELIRQAEELRKGERDEAIAKVRAIVAEFELTPEDIQGAKSRAGTASSKAGSKVAPKYINKATGATWTGRGQRPTWLNDQVNAGRALDEFLIQTPTE